MTSETKKDDDHIEIKFMDGDWIKMRNLLVVNMIKCDTEEKFSHLIEGLIASCFHSVEEFNKAREQFKMKELSRKEKEEIDHKLKFN